MAIYIDMPIAVMDLCRLVVAYRANAPAASGIRERLFDRLFNASDWSSVISREGSMLKPQETNVLLLLRTIANCFQEDTPVNEGQWIQQVKRSLFLSTPFDRSTRSLRH